MKCARGKFAALLAAAAAMWASGCTDAAKCVEGAGLVQSYRMAVRDADNDGYRPLAYWVRLGAAQEAPRSRDTVLYVHVGEIDNGPDRYLDDRSTINAIPEARTEHDPRFDRYLLRGRRLRYRGRPMPPAGDRPAYVDTSVGGGQVEIVFDAAPVATLADLTVGRHVVFEALIEPRQGWMKPFRRELWRQDWQLIATLPGGETVDIGDRFLVEHRDFRACLAMMRRQRAAMVRVVGQVLDAAPFKEQAARLKYVGTPRDVRGDVLIAVQELRILEDIPGEIRP